MVTGDLMPAFEPISLEKQDEYLERLAGSGIAASDYSFVNLWAWAQEYGLAWAWEDDLVWIRQSRPEHGYWAPVGPWEEIRWEEALSGLGEAGPVFSRVPQELVALWEKRFPGRLEIDDSRDHWDYVYSVEDLVKLSGNRYHRKKNLLNQFRKRYAYEYFDIRGDMVRRVEAMKDRWCEWRDCESVELLAAENRAIERLLEAWNRLRNIMGGALFVEGRGAAFCLAEQMAHQTVVIHAEKGFPEFAGAYQAINQMFLSAHREFTWVNRQQDLGEEGLRRAKLSYHPVDLIRKHRVRFL